MAPDPLERFRPSGWRWVGVVGIVILTALCVLEVAQDTSRAGLTVALGLALFAAVMYIALVRPTMLAHLDHLLVRNLVTDVCVPWHLITDAEVRQTLRIYTRDRVVHAVAVGRSARQQLRDHTRATAGGSGTGSMFGMGRVEKHASEGQPNLERGTVEYEDFVAQRVLTLAGQQSSASRHLDRLEQHWAYPEIIVLLALAAAFVVLLVLAVR